MFTLPGIVSDTPYLGRTYKAVKNYNRSYIGALLMTMWYSLVVWIVVMDHKVLIVKMFIGLILLWVVLLVKIHRYNRRGVFMDGNMETNYRYLKYLNIAYIVLLLLTINIGLVL